MDWLRAVYKFRCNKKAPHCGELFCCFSLSHLGRWFALGFLLENADHVLHIKIVIEIAGRGPSPRYGFNLEFIGSVIEDTAADVDSFGLLGTLCDLRIGEWFQLTMTGYNPAARIAPFPISAEERQSLKVPVLFVFGKRDNLVGDPEVARELVQNIPHVRVEVLDAGHLMGAEQPEQVNVLITEFFESE
jgi:pimeloyl-ACP methyl ester carboxylesterase